MRSNAKTSSIGSVSKKARVTIQDVARIAGVTPTTVSSALNGRGRVSDEKREAISRIANELGYHPKLAAQMMRGQSTGHIGLLLPGPDVSEASGWKNAGAILGYFIHLCEQRDIAYHIESHNTNAASFTPPNQLVNGMSDGIIVAGYVSLELRAWLDGQNHAWVSINEPSDYCVLSSDDEGVYMAVQRLAALGHRRIAYAGGPLQYLTHQLAFDGFQRATSEFVVERKPNWIFSADTDNVRMRIEQARNWARGVLGKEQSPTAIVCYDMLVARSIIHEALKMGINVPENLSVISAGLGSDAEKSPPLLSTIEVDFEGIIDGAMNLLLNRLNSASFRPDTRRVLPNIVMRETVSAI